MFRVNLKSTPWIAGLAISCALVVGVTAAIGQSPRRERTRAAAPDEKKVRSQWREGTVVELVGVFQGGGSEPIAFRPNDTNDSYRVLENLSLQRVAKMLELSQRRQWGITAMATEYQGGNYLLLKRVVLKGKSKKKAPAAATPASPPSR